MSERDVTIRKVRREDFAHIVRMTRDLAFHVAAPMDPKVNVDILETEGPLGRDRFRIFVAEEGGTPVGFCLYSFVFSGWRGACGLFVEDLYVDHSLRGLGIGKRLLAAALEAEKADGAAFIKLEVSLANDGALAFYRRMGFTLFEGEALMLLEAENFQP
jgi:ribosomal protein S18 acetylase RimI-like enzyme